MGRRTSSCTREEAAFQVQTGAVVPPDPITRAAAPLLSLPPQTTMALLLYVLGPPIADQNRSIQSATRWDDRCAGPSEGKGRGEGGAAECARTRVLHEVPQPVDSSGHHFPHVRPQQVHVQVAYVHEQKHGRAATSASLDARAVLLH